MTVNKTNKLIPKKNNSNNFLSIKKILNAVTAININSVIINDFNFFICCYLKFKIQYSDVLILK